MILEALRAHANTEIVIPTQGSLETRLARFLSGTMALLQARFGPIMAGLMAKAQFNATFHADFRATLIDARRAALRSILEQGQRDGEVDAAVDLDIMVDMLFGAMWYRLLLRHADLTDAFATELSRYVATWSAVPGDRHKERSRSGR